MKDWQFRQAIDTKRILLVDTAGLDWARTYDWGVWRESARSLQSSHPMVARDYEDFPWESQTVQEGECNETRAAYSRLFDQLLNNCRVIWAIPIH